MKRLALVLVALVVAYSSYQFCRPTPSTVPAKGEQAAVVTALLRQPVMTVTPIDDWDLSEVGRREGLLPEQIKARLPEKEIGFLVGFGESVSVARQLGVEWDATGHISDLNRYAFLMERLWRTTDRFEPATVRRIYARFGFATLHLSDGDIAAMEQMGPAELLRWLSRSEV